MYSICVHRYRQIDHVPKSTFLVSFTVLFVVHAYCCALIAFLRMILSKVDQSSNYLSVCILASAAGIAVHISTFILMQPGCVDPTLFRLHLYGPEEYSL